MKTLTIVAALCVGTMAGCATGNKSEPLGVADLVKFVDFSGQETQAEAPETADAVEEQFPQPSVISAPASKVSEVEQIQLLGEESKLIREKLEISGPATINLNGSTHGVDGAPAGKVYR